MVVSFLGSGLRIRHSWFTLRLMKEARQKQNKGTFPSFVKLTLCSRFPGSHPNGRLLPSLLAPVARVNRALNSANFNTLRHHKTHGQKESFYWGGGRGGGRGRFLCRPSSDATLLAFSSLVPSHPLLVPLHGHVAMLPFSKSRKRKSLGTKTSVLSFYRGT